LVPQQGPYGERRPFPEPSFTHPSGFPVKELSLERGGKIMVNEHGAPRERKFYIQLGAAWFPQAIVYDAAIASLVLRSLQHDTFLLGFGKPEFR